jgi:hypothetical protein
MFTLRALSSNRSSCYSIFLFLSFPEWITDLTQDFYLRRATHEIINVDSYEYAVWNGTRDIRIRVIQDHGSLTHAHTYD